ncbi:hypothetical protein KUTeg_015629 [Tegillarca granosa]|uniref:Receptor ligand binding region domain-containing protein n=1 Tax=Tegillarca granosa TaxID=220873 RepID=A0ABQ9EVW8_TEGGR|nr:hypothetical protein KUTeg_015629 [Tegillarca granosa]
MIEKLCLIPLLFLISNLELSASLDITICSIVSSGGSLPYDYRRSGPAVDMALSTLQARFGNQVNFQYVYRNPGPGCSFNEIGAIAADVYSKYNISVFIGPGK